MRAKHFLLLILIPLSEIKAIFYDSNIKVPWYLFSEKKKFLCNVFEDYSNIIILGVVFFFLTKPKNDLITRKICLFLFIVNFLDLVFIGLMGNALYLLKIPISIITYSYICKRLNGFLTH